MYNNQNYSEPSVHYALMNETKWPSLFRWSIELTLKGTFTTRWNIFQQNPLQYDAFPVSCFWLYLWCEGFGLWNLKTAAILKSQGLQTRPFTDKSASNMTLMTSKSLTRTTPKPCRCKELYMVSHLFFFFLISNTSRLIEMSFCSLTDTRPISGSSLAPFMHVMSAQCRASPWTNSCMPNTSR